MSSRVVPTVILLAVLAVVAAFSARLPDRHRSRLYLVAARSLMPQTVGEGQFPLSEDQIHSMAQRNDRAEIRAHAWAIFKYLVASDSTSATASKYPAKWDTDAWIDKCTLGLASSLCPFNTPTAPDCKSFFSEGSGSIARPVQTMTRDGKLAQPPFSSLTSVRYNEAAASFIQAHCLATTGGITKLALDESSSPNGPNSQFSSNAVIVKLIWAMPAGSELAVWNNTMLNDSKDPIGQPLPSGGDNWPYKVAVSSSDRPCTWGAYKTKTGTETGYDMVKDAVPLSCFYHQKFPCDQISADNAGDHFPRGAFLCQGSADVILIGMHVITAEQHEWVWSTFWWTPNPASDTAYHGDAPEWVRQRGPWQYFSMNTMLSKPTLTAPNETPQGIFNPYLEGPQQHALTSNCMFCHQMAVIRDSSNSSTDSNSPSTVDEFNSGMPSACAYYQSLSDRCRDLLTAEAQDNGRPLLNNLPMTNDENYFLNATSTHSLWSLANAHDSKALEDVATDFRLKTQKPHKKIPPFRH